nr:hypothetical protein Iba_chr07eCG2830 [Ipomoea batatas]
MARELLCSPSGEPSCSPSTSLKRSLSTRSRTVGGGTTAVDFKLSEPDFKPETKSSMNSASNDLSNAATKRRNCDANPIVLPLPPLASDKFGDINHFSASRGEAFSNSAISKELPTVVSNHRACNSNPATRSSAVYHSLQGQ